MQWVKTDTAPIWVKQRIGPKVIYIDYDSHQENKRNFYSVFFKKEKSNEDGNQKMDSVM